VIEPVPPVVPVNVTEQLVTPAVVNKLQVSATSEPPVVPAVSMKVTIPVGALEAVVVSTTAAVTEAVQLVPPNGMLQLTFGTLVDVPSFATVIVFEVPMLPLCAASPPYVPVTVAVPTATPVKVAEQLVTPAVVDKVQLVSTVPTAVFEETKLTLPVGALAAVVVSATVAVQVEVPVGTIVPGVQATPVDVLSLPVTVTVTVAATLALVL
jgi:hypothetical protein